MKKHLVFLLVTVATLSLAACGNASKETATDTRLQQKLVKKLIQKPAIL